MPDKLPTDKEALKVALDLINQFVGFAKEGVVPEVTLGTFRTIGTLKEVVG